LKGGQIFTFLGTSGGQKIYLAIRGESFEIAVEKGKIRTPLGDLPLIKTERNLR